MPNAMQNMVGKTLYDTKNQKVGTIDNVYVTRQDEQPVFASVLEGLLNMRLVFVPVRLTHVEGDKVVADTTKDVINKSPSIRAGHELDQEETQALYSYYDAASDQKPEPRPEPSNAPQAPQNQSATSSDTPEMAPTIDKVRRTTSPQFDPHAFYGEPSTDTHAYQAPPEHPTDTQQVTTQPMTSSPEPKPPTTLNGFEQEIDLHQEPMKSGDMKAHGQTSSDSMPLPSPDASQQ